MRVCIIGGSGHASFVFRAMSADPTIEVVGIAPGSEGENTAKFMKEAEKRGQSPKYYDDYRVMLDELKPDIAAVNCHFGDHAKVNFEVLSRKIHLFGEKPLATTMEELAVLEKEYERAGVEVAAMLGLRYDPAFYTAWHAVQDGKIGEVRLLTAQKSYRLGSRPNFFKNRVSYGGTIPWVGSHAIDWVYWFAGEDFISVMAHHSAMHNRGLGTMEMTGLCHFEFTNEVFGSVNIDYLRPSTAESHGDDRVRAAGTKGVIEVRGGRVYLISADQPGTQELPLMQPPAFFAEFVKQVRGEGQCLVSAKDSFRVTEACLRARESADTGKMVYF
ncbi:MAG: Gfo/Idh/MocA family protein [Candidatus Wallacebacter cryptica]|jgi:predicted dehydrogenase|nr:Gfo/Idh/MocA family oxidoreductase [Bacillota bacterium]